MKVKLTIKLNYHPLVGDIYIAQGKFEDHHITGRGHLERGAISDFKYQVRKIRKHKRYPREVEIDV